MDPDNVYVGQLNIPMNSSFLINDGQHRRAAVEEAIKQRPELRDETISVVFFIDAGLRRSQQMFADLNTHAVRPSKSLGILYDHRDDLSQLACRLVKQVPCFQTLTEMEKTSISNRSRKLFTLSSIFHATAKLLGRSQQAQITTEDEALSLEFWSEVCAAMPDWQDALNNKISSAELRRDYVHAHGVALQAIAVVGRALIGSNPDHWKDKIRELSRVDWSRSNTKEWEGRALVGGKVSKAHSSVTLTANVIKRQLGLSLTYEEAVMEKNYAGR
jgi:DNA sulfur modification protein DndB